jgi:phage tail protein X
MDNLQYVTLDGERWDSVAHKAYGNAGLSKIIIEANPDVTITDVLPAGIVLNIPVQREEAVFTSQELLPPWLKD